MVDGAFGSLFAFSETLTRTTPLILTGLAAAVAFRAKLWNIGAEGQLYAGALAAVAVGSGADRRPADRHDPAGAPRRSAGRRAADARPGAAQAEIRRRRGGHHPPPQLRHAALRPDDAGRPAAGPDEPRLAAIRADHRFGDAAAAARPDAGPFRPADRPRRGGRRLDHDAPHRLGRRDPRRRRERARRPLRRHPGHRDHGPRRA